MDLAELKTILTVASEHSFSRAAARLHRTQPAVSQAVRRLEEELNERLFDRTAKGGRLTEAGRILLNYARRLTELRDEAASAVRELQDFRRGRVAIGANEAAVHALLPIVSRFRDEHPDAQVEVRRVPARQVAAEVLNGALDFGVLTFQPRERGLHSVTIGADELVLLTSPDHPLADRKEISMEEFGRQTVIAHNDPSPARERVLRISEQRHAPINIQMSFPSLDGIKRAVEMGLGVALLPRRCALTEIARGQLAVVRVSQLRLARQVRLICRRSGEMSRAASAVLDAARREERKIGDNKGKD